MEFFATTIIPASAADLQRRLTISKLPYWCASIELEDRAGGALVIRRQVIYCRCYGFCVFHDETFQN